MIEHPTCSTCVHFGASADGVTGQCGGQPPVFVQIDATRTKRIPTIVEAGDWSCPTHQDHGRYIEAAAKAKASEVAMERCSERVREVLSNADGLGLFDPRMGFNCSCVRLGLGDGEKGRERVNLPEGRYLTVLTSCRICGGAGKVDGVPAHWLAQPGSMNDLTPEEQLAIVNSAQPRRDTPRSVHDQNLEAASHQRSDDGLLRDINGQLM